jgi:glycosyltransferase involved in cell wall biosynthesis
VPELLSVSFACVLSSSNEGFSNSILEYSAASKPVVATRVGGASEAIVENETGLLVESDDHQHLAECLIRLLEKPEIAEEFGRKGRQRVIENFSLNSQLEKTLRIYNFKK